MCGRFSYYGKIDELIRSLDINDVDDSAINEMENYNVAPTQAIPVIFDSDGRRKIKLMRFGLIPFWVKDVIEMKRYRSTFNARTEGIFTKPSYRMPIKKQRCVIPMNGFYEWQKGTKIPHYIYTGEAAQNGSSYLYAAGIFDTNSNIYEHEFYSFSICTLEADQNFIEMHHRQAVFLEKHQLKGWLDRDVEDPEVISTFFKPKKLNWHRVGKEVGSVRNNKSDLLQKIK